MNVQQRFSHFDPESHTPHEIENNLVDSGQSGSECCHHHDQVTQSGNSNPSDTIFGLRTNHQPSEIFSGVNQNLAPRMSCNCNIHIHHILNVTPTTKCVERHYGQSYPHSQNVKSHVQQEVERSCRK